MLEISIVVDKNYTTFKNSCVKNMTWFPFLTIALMMQQRYLYDLAKYAHWKSFIYLNEKHHVLTYLRQNRRSSFDGNSK